MTLRRVFTYRDVNNEQFDHEILVTVNGTDVEVATRPTVAAAGFNYRVWGPPLRLDYADDTPPPMPPIAPDAHLDDVGD